MTFWWIFRLIATRRGLTAIWTTFREWNGKMTSRWVMQNVIVATRSPIRVPLRENNRVLWNQDNAKLTKVRFRLIFQPKRCLFFEIKIVILLKKFYTFSVLEMRKVLIKNYPYFILCKKKKIIKRYKYRFFWNY